MSNMLSNTSVTLLISGSIAAYKSAELVRELQRQGASVNVVMSKSATEFITPLTLQTLSGNPVYTNMFDLTSEQEIGHIALADKADLILCAPATADIIAKSAHGIADDTLSTVLLAAKCPVVFAPSMNVNMWQNPVTQENVSKLKSQGKHVMDPDEGSLACGWNAAGRFPDISRIIDVAQYALYSKDLKGTRVVVTAGPTRESIDPVRFISNRSSGKMGYAIARVAHWLGADVTLITGPTSIDYPAGINVIEVNTSEEMKDAVNASLMEPASDDTALQILYMAAGVSDHYPAIYSREKLKMDKTKGYELRFEPSVDILKDLGEIREDVEKASGVRLLLVGFAAETGDYEQMISNARLKRDYKKADMIVANFAVESFGNDSTRVWLIDKFGKEEEVSLSDKHRISERMIRYSLKL